MLFDPSFPYYVVMSILGIPPNSNIKLVSSTLFYESYDTMSQNLLQESIEKDIAWAIAGCLPDKKKRIPLLGSWSSFQEETTIGNIQKSNISNFSTKSPEYPFCKTYPDFLVDTMEVLRLPYIFVHTDEQVYARILHKMWKHRDLY